MSSWIVFALPDWLREISSRRTPVVWEVSKHSHRTGCDRVLHVMLISLKSTSCTTTWTHGMVMSPDTNQSCKTIDRHTASVSTVFGWVGLMVWLYDINYCVQHNHRSVSVLWRVVNVSACMCIRVSSHGAAACRHHYRTVSVSQPFVYMSVWVDRSTDAFWWCHCS